MVAQNFIGTTSACAENTPPHPLAPRALRNYLRVRGEYSQTVGFWVSMVELPPRARRILCLYQLVRIFFGTTSACAENTWLAKGRVCLARNYLRVRGEYHSDGINFLRFLELPPRARRIHRSMPLGRRPRGTTSACAENTCERHGGAKLYRNYLRVRGEYPTTPPSPKGVKELPPRARRILPDRGLLGIHGGTTSACAENTLFVSAGEDLFWNYLRVRGEYLVCSRFSRCSRELPPRARRIPNTCGESWIFSWNYLRVRGEYAARYSGLVSHWELPPRARRIQHATVRCCPCAGTTSACAENTSEGKFTVTVARNYLRVRGEYTHRRCWRFISAELPPRARRIRPAGASADLHTGTTSACAENTMMVSFLSFTNRNYLRVRGEYPK